MESMNFKFGIFGAEPWSENMREEIERKLNITAVDIYGLSEVMGPGVAIECHEAKQGLHVFEDHFIPEIVDPNTLDPLAPWRHRGIGIYVADQGGVSGYPLSDTGYYLAQSPAVRMWPHPHTNEPGYWSQ